MKNLLFIMLLCMITCFTFISCSEPVPTTPALPEIIDISNPAVLDEYVNINGQATPSTYRSQATPLDLPAFSERLTMTFKSADNAKYTVSFLGSSFNITSGTLEINLTGVDSGVYPLTVSAMRSVSARDNASCIWVRVNNGSPIPKMSLLEIKKDSAKLLFNQVTEDTAAASVSVYLRTEATGEGSKQTEFLLTSDSQEVQLTGLNEDQSFQIGVKRPEDNEIHWLMVFKTFKDLEEGIQLFYQLDLTSPESHQVGVKIFGYYKGTGDLNFNNHGYHTEGGMARGSSFALNASPQITMTVNSNKDLSLDTNGNTEGFFTLQYNSDKSAIVTDNHGVQGYLGEDYMIASHEQLLFAPNNMSNIDACLSLILPEGWQSATGWTAAAFGMYQFPEIFNHCAAEFFRAGNVYAYDSKEFNKTTLNYGDFIYNIILPKMLSSDYVDDIQAVYEKLVVLWGSQMPLDKYTVMFPLSPAPNLHIYAGEWSTGQAFSTNWGIIGEMFVHQMYHVWNAWAVGTSWDHSSADNNALWNEGFNEYYDDKILTQLNFKTTTIQDHNWLKGWYNQYKAIRGTADDLNLLEGNGHLPNNLEYFKGAVYTYIWDQAIMELSNNSRSMDDVLAYLWERYATHGEPVSYDKMLTYIQTIVPGGMDDWWKAYLVNNEPVYLYEFEDNPPSFSVNQPTPENRTSDVSADVTLSWQVSNPDGTDLMYDLYLAELQAMDSPMAAQYTGLNETSKSVALKAGTKYIWRIRAYDQSGNEYFTSVYFFETAVDETFHTDVTASEARAIIADNEGNPNFIIIDLRTMSEYNAGHIENAININYYDANFRNLIGVLNRDKIYLIYCGSGGRSRQALQIMIDMGFKKIYHLARGYNSW